VKIQILDLYHFLISVRSLFRSSITILPKVTKIFQNAMLELIQIKEKNHLVEKDKKKKKKVCMITTPALLKTLINQEINKILAPGKVLVAMVEMMAMMSKKRSFLIQTMVKRS
jgi:hypothetical protein